MRAMERGSSHSNASRLKRIREIERSATGEILELRKTHAKIVETIVTRAESAKIKKLQKKLSTR